MNTLTNVTYFDDTDSAGQALRVWLPSNYDPAVACPAVLWCHPAGHTYQINPGGYWASAIPQLLSDLGYLVVAPNMHTNPAGSGSTYEGWGADVALVDVENAYAYLTSRFNVAAKVALMGGSMGGLGASLVLARGNVPNIKGVYLIDAVLSLSAMYANATYTAQIATGYGIVSGTLSGATTAGATTIPTTAAFPSVGTILRLGNGTANVEDVTTTAASTGTSVAVTATTKAHGSGDQVSDYPTKTSGHDPLLKSAATYTGKRWRFIASTADTVVDKTKHADPFATLVAAAPEASVVPLNTAGHLDGTHVIPADIKAFLARCFA